ncbi:MAG: D-alanyl-D-alanine carboxypeptidase [Alphaproteobacteria bacterium]|nr:D-alanyl-D-alanine carboxypeptidase [Alphaproteobacteria bacterium]
MKLNKVLFNGLSCLMLVVSTNAWAIDTKAKNMILVDFETGEYLYQKDITQPIPPASMSKLMTVYMIFDKLRDGSLSLEDTFTVSENAWRKGGAASGGSTMFLAIGDKVTVDQLLKGIIIQSGNDACIVAAENIAGDEDSFIEKMNEKAKELGLNNSYFANVTGLPHPDHKMSVEDLAILARKIIEEFPQFYHLFSQKEFVYNNIKQGNRNPLLYSMPYADGLKTGHTDEAGFCLTASAKKGDRRIIGVMTGLKSNKERSDEADKMMSWAFREYDNYRLKQKGDKIADVPVWYGVDKTVPMVLSQDVIKTIKKSNRNNVKMTAIYDKPIKAPVSMGQEIGVLKIEIPDAEPYTVPLVAGQTINKVGIWGKIKTNFKYLLMGD